MADTTAVIEIIRRIVADDTADLRERVQHLETKVTGTVEATEFIDNQPKKAEPEKPNDLQPRLDAIKDLHRLDATPVQWTRSNDGKMVEAPDGLWEIACLACTHKAVWKEGDKKPPQCKTWLLADGQSGH